MSYYAGQGRVFIAQRDAGGNPVNMRWVGNVPELKISLNVQTVEHKESYSGQQLTDLQLIKSKEGEFTCSLEYFTIENLLLALYGESASAAAGTVSGETLAGGVAAGDIRLLANPFVSNVVVRDSAGTPKTLPAAQYTVFAGQGAIQFNDVTTGGPYTQPFRVDYTFAGRRQVAMFRSAPPEVWVRFDGVNTANAMQRVVIDLYRVAINPTKDLAVLGDEVQRFELTGRVLADLTKPETGPLGQFGRILLPV
ncbi:MAG: hypothetical protein RMK90_12600 [Acetobacteraceae bacterium]|nr:hypothetical protein [Acetobacteraceae bacterium]